jgi:alpha-1,2-mannosyltransferase
MTAATAAQTRTFIRLAIPIGAFLLTLEIAYLLLSPLPYDSVGYLIGRDFVNTWMGGRIALTGDPTPYFNYATYNDALRHAFGATYPWHVWSYPPHLLLFTWPLALMPYLTAYVLWCVAGMVVYLAVVAEGERRLDHLALLVLSPAVLVNIFSGQNGFLTAALLIGALIQLDRRPLVSGMLFGLLTIKPQLGLMVPVMLILTGRWRVMFAAIATVAALVGATTLAFGTKVWTAFYEIAMPMQNKAVTVGTGFFMPMMPTVFMNARIVALPLSVGFAMQAVASLFALAAVMWTFWRRRDHDLSMALFVTASFVATPYAANYDMVMLGWVLLRLMRRDDNTRLDMALMFAVWVLPLATILLGQFHIPGSALVLIAFAGRLVWRLDWIGVAQAAHRSRPLAPKFAG